MPTTNVLQPASPARAQLLRQYHELLLIDDTDADGIVQLSSIATALGRDGSRIRGDRRDARQLRERVEAMLGLDTPAAKTERTKAGNKVGEFDQKARELAEQVREFKSEVDALRQQVDGKRRQAEQFGNGLRMPRTNADARMAVEIAMDEPVDTDALLGIEAEWAKLVQAIDKAVEPLKRAL